MPTWQMHCAARAFDWRRALLGTKVAGDRTDRAIGGVVVGGHSLRPEPAKPGASELRIRNEGPLYRLDQSDAGELQTGADGTDVPADRRAPSPDSRHANGGACALCAY